MVNAKTNALKVACLLIATKRGQLLLPNTMIQEVLTPRLLQHNTTAHDYIAGEITLSDGTTINVLDVDRLDRESGIYGREKKPIVVIKPDNTTTSVAFGILANKTPKIVYCNEQNLETNFNPTLINEFAISYVVVVNENAIIPDIEKLRMLALRQ